MWARPRAVATILVTDTCPWTHRWGCGRWIAVSGDGYDAGEDNDDDDDDDDDDDYYYDDYDVDDDVKTSIRPMSNNHQQYL